MVRSHRITDRAFFSTSITVPVTVLALILLIDAVQSLGAMEISSRGALAVKRSASSLPTACTTFFNLCDEDPPENTVEAGSRQFATCCTKGGHEKTTCHDLVNEVFIGDADEQVDDSVCHALIDLYKVHVDLLETRAALLTKTFLMRRSRTKGHVAGLDATLPGKDPLPPDPAPTPPMCQGPNHGAVADGTDQCLEVTGTAANQGVFNQNCAAGNAGYYFTSSGQYFQCSNQAGSSFDEATGQYVCGNAGSCSAPPMCQGPYLEEVAPGTNRCYTLAGIAGSQAVSECAAGNAGYYSTSSGQFFQCSGTAFLDHHGNYRCGNAGFCGSPPTCQGPSLGEVPTGTNQCYHVTGQASNLAESQNRCAASSAGYYTTSSGQHFQCGVGGSSFSSATGVYRCGNAGFCHPPPPPPATCEGPNLGEVAEGTNKCDEVTGTAANQGVFNQNCAAGNAGYYFTPSGQYFQCSNQAGSSFDEATGQYVCGNAGSCSAPPMCQGPYLEEVAPGTNRCYTLAGIAGSQAVSECAAGNAGYYSTSSGQFFQCSGTAFLDHHGNYRCGNAGFCGSPPTCQGPSLGEVPTGTNQCYHVTGQASSLADSQHRCAACRAGYYTTSSGQHFQCGVGGSSFSSATGVYRCGNAGFCHPPQQQCQ